MDIFAVLGGFALLLMGGDGLVRGAVAVAQRLGVSPLLIGLTLVGFGTSTPELITSLDAAISGSPGIAIGNVVGSNIANILLILGITATISAIACEPRAFRRDGLVLVASALLLAALAPFGELGPAAGGLFLVGLVAYVGYTYLKERNNGDPAAKLHAEEAELAAPGPRKLWLAGLFVVGGIAVTILGAHLLVTGSIGLARNLGVSESVIGLTIVAVGTSLPELATSVMAAVRRQGDIAFGNIVGSNIYNILGILGVVALVQPLAVPAEILRIDLWVMLAATALLVVFAVTGWRITRSEGVIFLLAYGGYLAALVLRNGAA